MSLPSYFRAHAYFRLVKAPIFVDGQLFAGPNHHKQAPDLYIIAGPAKAARCAARGGAGPLFGIPSTCGSCQKRWWAVGYGMCGCGWTPCQFQYLLSHSLPAVMHESLLLPFQKYVHFVQHVKSSKPHEEKNGSIKQMRWIINNSW